MTCPTNSGCDQCFRDTLGSTTSSSDVFVPRAGAKEQIDLATSTISAEALQGAGVTPIGDIKSSYTLDDGPSTTQWPWAVMKGQLIIKWTMPSSLNYSNAVYLIKYTTKSYTVNSSDQKNVGTDATHVECSYFYAAVPAQWTDGQCNAALDVFYAATPRNSSLAGETLCTRGTASSVVYSSVTEQWTYTCAGTNGGASDSCVVDLDFLNSSEPCRIEATDTSGVVPFDTSFLCSGDTQGKTVISISRNGAIVDALEWDSQDYSFDDSGTYKVSCYPDFTNDRSNVCTMTVFVSGDCGNDVEESDEQCDDGNTTSGDGCSRTCQLEWENGAVCGNGTVETGEQCDDGNLDDGDTCTSICQDTAPDTGPVAALLILLFLSLGGTGYYLYRKSKIVA